MDDAVAALDEIIAKYFEIIKNIYSLVEELQIGMAFFYRGWFQIQICRNFEAIFVKRL